MQFCTYEYFSAFFNLLMALGTVGSSRLSGQVMMISKQIYQLAGGHSSVKGSVLETFFFTDVLRANHRSTQTVLGRGILRMRMYPEGISSLTDGWMKAFARGSVALTLSQWIALMAWFSGLFLSFVFPLEGVAYFAFSVSVSLFLRRIGNYPIWIGLAYPLCLGFFLCVFLVSIFRARSGHSVSWKGRATKRGSAQ